MNATSARTRWNWASLWRQSARRIAVLAHRRLHHGTTELAGREWRSIAQVGGNIALSTDFINRSTPIKPISSTLCQLYSVQPDPTKSFAIPGLLTNIGVAVGRNLERWGRLAGSALRRRTQ